MFPDECIRFYRPAQSTHLLEFATAYTFPLAFSPASSPGDFKKKRPQTFNAKRLNLVFGEPHESRPAHLCPL